MLIMSGVAAQLGVEGQGLPHNIPPEASAEYPETGWESGFERDGSEVYQYQSPDFDKSLLIKICEIFDDEPNEELGEDDPDYWAVNKEYSTWTAECNLTGHDDLWHLAEATNERHAAIYVIMAETAQEAIDLIVSQIPDAWMTACETSAPAIREGWSQSYAEVAGKVPAPMWI